VSLDDIPFGPQAEEALDISFGSVGARLLGATAAFVRRFVVLSAAQAAAIALFVAHTHAFEAADYTPYFHIRSAEKRSGKSLLLDVLELLVRKPIKTMNISDAALFRAIEAMSPTLLLDEVDAIYGPKARDREDLRGMLNAGFSSGGVVLRVGGKKMDELRAFPVFCPKAFAGIGSLPDTLADRTIPIRLERRTPEEMIDRFTRRDVVPEAEQVKAHVAEWGEAHVDALGLARPDLPDALDDRARDIWEPLLAIADLGGGGWPERARAAALELSGSGEREDDSITARLLNDIHTVFEANDARRYRTADLIDELSKIEESPWGDWFGKPISPQALSKLLQPHRIKTQSVRTDDGVVKSSSWTPSAAC
jgi:hypothetical protein